MAATVLPSVKPYSAAQLRELLVGKSDLPRHRDAPNKNHIDYLTKYLAALRAETIVVEPRYVDHDFLEDYSAYYVRCFKTYERVCQRLHFFRRRFTAREWSSLLEGRQGILTASRLNESYLGFIVVRPLPLAVIGRTCLKPFVGKKKEGRAYPTTRKYEVNLCGINLSCETLGFQEQDEVAAKCATAALWSVFQGTGKLFQHAIPSPVEITKQAAIVAPFGGRAIPSLGLSDEQMGHAIHQVGLEPLILFAENSAVLKATTYAYLRGHIPLLLNLTLHDPGSTDPPHQTHEVAVVGYRLKKTVHSRSDGVIPLLAHRMECLYVHDDRIGPFARMSFEDDTNRLSTEWPSSHRPNTHLVASPGNLIIPVYHKIRIPFQKIYEDVSHLHGLLVNVLLPAFAQHAAAPVPRDLEWDIHLATVNAFKADFRHNDSVGRGQKRRVLQQCLPRFLWRATAISGNKIVLDLLFDATDIEHGDTFICPVHAEANLVPLLREVARKDAVPSEYRKTSAPNILNWFADNQMLPD